LAICCFSSLIKVRKKMAGTLTSEKTTVHIHEARKKKWKDELIPRIYLNNMYRKEF
jgi:hypothetical protein